MAIVLKFNCDGDIRRIRVAALTMEEMQKAAQQAFPELAQGGFELKYRDDEDDLCMLTAGTCTDFAALYEHANHVRIEVIKKSSVVSSAPPSCPDAPMDSAGCVGLNPSAPALGAEPQNLFAGMPLPFMHFLSHFQGVFASQGDEALTTLLVHSAPMALQHIAQNHEGINRLAAEKPEIIRAVIQSLKDSLEPFPQMQEIHMAADRVMQSESLEGLAGVLEDFLRTLTQLPFEQQRDITSVIVAGTLEKICQGLPGMELHPTHSFDGKEQPDEKNMPECMWGKGFGKGLGKALLKGLGWKGLGKGFGKCKGKGWGKHGGHPWHGHDHNSGERWAKKWGKWHEGLSSDSSDTSSSSGSDKRESKKEMRDVRRECRKATQEAKNIFKAERKAAKKTLKDAKKAQKEKLRATRMNRQLERIQFKGNTVQGMDEASQASAPQIFDFNFPVEVADGRRLMISWNSCDIPEEVAAKFATQHRITADEIPAIVHFIHHAIAVTRAPTETAACEQMDISETPPSDPPYTGCSEEQLQALEQMGFTDRELNMQLLAAHNGNLQSVLEQLL